MADITYNHQSAYTPPPSTPTPGSGNEPFGDQSSGKNSLIIIGLIAVIMLAIIYSVYLFFGKPTPKPASPEKFDQANPDIRSN
mgnify:CR=1 FL=1